MKQFKMDIVMNMNKLDNGEMVERQNAYDSTEKSLLSLDDMVLTKIMDHLCIVDLTNLADTCTRLKYLTKNHFEKHHSHVSWTNYRNTDRNTIKPIESERVFKQIGKYVKTVKLSLWYDFEFYEILVILAKHCTGLDTLILESIRMNRPLVFCDPLVSLLFSKLKRFVISGCFWTGWCPLDIFFGENSSLEQLSVLNCCAYNGYSYRLHLSGFRALKQLRLLDCRNVLTESELQGCFEKNTITSLFLSNVGNFNLFQGNLIDALCKTINSLTIDYFSSINLDEISRLSNLKILRIRCYVFCDVDSLLSKLSSNCTIEELEITKMFISSSTIDVLKKFKNLRYLKIECSLNSIPHIFFTTLPKILPQLEQFAYTYSAINDDDIIYMFKLMPNLKRLSLFGCNSLTNDTYLKIVEILKNDWKRPKLEFIPPKFEILKSLKAIESVKKVLC